MTSITDPSNITINYTRDSIGRLTAVSSAPFAGITTYASNIKYRAWDALKSLNTGDNRTLTASFNSRLKASAFTVSGLISKTYDYYADGNLRFSSDLLDHRFDRFYSFDHVGRLKEAFSGAEARGEPATTNRPYKQTYGYDAFNHLTARTTAIWWTHLGSISDSYENNRHLPQGNTWQYDADGRLLTAPGAYKTYDAAGRNTYLDTYGYGSATLGMDGDGRQIKTEETTWDEGSQTYITDTKYYLRSSVLGGRVLTEIWSAAATRTFVYAGSTVIALQGRSYGWESISWEHKDPSGASVRYGGYGQELDPLGGDAGTSAQTEIPDEGAFLPYGSSYSPANPNIAYSVDGVRVLPDDFMAFAGFALTDTLGLMEYFARGTELPPLDITPEQRFLLQDALYELGFDRISDFLALLPQKPQVIRVPLDVDKLKGLIQDRLKHGDCAEYVGKLINKAAELSGGTEPAESTDIMTLFEKIRSQPNGGILFDTNEVPGHPEVPQVAGGGGWAWGSYLLGNAMINVYTMGYYTDNPSAAARIPYEYGLRGLHEVIHKSGKSWGYTEAQLTQAARALEPDAEYAHWNLALKAHCVPIKFH